MSVVIPSYNAAPYVEQAIRSVLDQTHAAHEVIVVDDGSTDDTAERVQAFGPPVRYVWQANAERSAARNHGLRLATGELTAFLDADDVWRPRKLERQLDLLRRRPALGFVYCWVELTDRHLRPLRVVGCGRALEEADGAEAFGELILRNWVTGGASTVLAPTELLRRQRGFDPELRYVEDWDLWLRLAAEHPLGFVPEPLTRYRAHGMRLAEKQVALGVPEQYPAVVEKALRLPAGRALAEAHRSSARAAAGLHAALLCYAVGDRRRGGRELESALRLSPERLLSGPENGLVADLVGFALGLRDDWTPLVEARDFVEGFFAGLPAGAESLVARRGPALRQLHAAYVFRAWSEGRRDEVRRHWLSMLRHDPGLLRNRGVIAMAARILLGR